MQPKIKVTMGMSTVKLNNIPKSPKGSRHH